MAMRWIVRVSEKEYGPADLDELREWKEEGRLIPTNLARPEDVDVWGTAAGIPGLFDAPTPVQQAEADSLFRRRTFGEILVETFSIYRKGFWPFFAFSLVAAIPSMVLQFTSPRVEIIQGTPTSLPPFRDLILPLSMFLVALLARPIFLAGIQLKTVDVTKRGGTSFVGMFKETLRLWPRFAKLSLFVYGSYFFWTALLVVAMLFLLEASRSGSLGIVLLMFLATMFFAMMQIFMVGRLWIRFLFWQQSAAISDLDGAQALRESSELARSRSESRWINRPLWRGVLIASLWLGVVIAVSLAASIPVMIYHLSGITNVEEMAATLQRLSQNPPSDRLTMICGGLSALVLAALRPLLGIAFVVLFFDAKADTKERS